MKKMINFAVVLAMACMPMAAVSAQNNSSGGDQGNQGPDKPVSSDGVQGQVEPGSSQKQGQGSPGNPEPSTGQQEPAVDLQQEKDQGTNTPADKAQQNRVEKNNPGQGKQKGQEARSGTATQAQKQKGPNEKALQRRSRVANAVQEMVRVGERNPNVGQQIREVAQQQKQHHKKIEESVQEAERNSLMRFLVGANHKKLDQAKKNISEYEEEIEKLEEAKKRIGNQQDKEVIDGQIQKLEQVKQEWEQEIQEAEQGFSLFGWAFKLFS